MRLGRFQRIIALIAAGILLLAQVEVAAYACANPGAGYPARMQMEAGMPCAEADARQPNLCLEQARFGTQSSDRSVSTTVPVAVLLYVLAPPLPPADPSAGKIRLRSLTAQATAPPLSIQYCCFRT